VALAVAAPAPGALTAGRPAVVRAGRARAASSR
jgi:hypothetical protein